jgi:hypothetical protein
VSHPATTSTAFTPAILDTVLVHLAPHFLPSAGDDLPAARHAASLLLAAYGAATDAELYLAAEVISFSFHALEALSEAAAPDLAETKKLRLRGSAVSLSREAHKTQRKLDQLQRARVAASNRSEAEAPPPRPAATADKPGTEQALGLIEFAREALEASTKKGGVHSWTLSRQQRRAAERIAENLKRNKARQEQLAPPAPPPPGINQAGAI